MRQDRRPLRKRPFCASLVAGIILWLGAGDAYSQAQYAHGPVPAGGTRPASAVGEKPRLLVLTDIGGDPDDQQSLVRLLVHANEFDIEGLIASASGTPGELRQPVTRADLIRETVAAYGKVRDNLAVHAQGFPAVESLLSVVKSGNSERGRDAIGNGCDTAGSRWLIACADRDDPRPLCVSIWGGQTDLAQALWSIRRDRGEAGLRRFIDKLCIFDIADQDKISEWIWQEFPGLFYVLSNTPRGHDRRLGIFRGMYLLGDESLTSLEWIDTHVCTGHGPLGALYPRKTWTEPNPHGALKEGDTPSWFYFLPFGLGDPQHPEWGGWGGRFVNVGDARYRDVSAGLFDETDPRTSVARWREDFQNEFVARMDWCVKPRDAANHPPVALFNGTEGTGILKLSGRPGDTIKLSAGGSRDPDGDHVLPHWWIYSEAGSYRGAIPLTGETSLQSQITLPGDSAGTTLHVILTLRDTGNPPLARYRRAVIAVAGP